MKIIISILLLVFTGCTTKNKVADTGAEKQSEFIPVFTSGPPLLVYKTKDNYDNLVSVILTDDKSEIVSYPHPQDIRTGSSHPLPVLLSNGYLLDTRGIGKNVAFLKLTYEQYAKLEIAPPLKDLYSLILDKDPLVELCNCGIKIDLNTQVNKLNKLIEGGKLRTTCKPIK
ncbi:MAG: hypothetical protein KA444_00300 [Bacteroidia bacterium]|nr:hypothetical protein [Bacteroidia bacterium]